MKSFLVKKKAGHNYYSSATIYSISITVCKKLQKIANETSKVSIDGDYALLPEKEYYGEIKILGYNEFDGKVKLGVIIDGLDINLNMYPGDFINHVKNGLNFNIPHKYKIEKNGYNLHLIIV